MPGSQAHALKTIILKNNNYKNISCASISRSGNRWYLDFCYRIRDTIDSLNIFETRLDFFLLFNIWINLEVVFLALFAYLNVFTLSIDRSTRQEMHFLQVLLTGHEDMLCRLKTATRRGMLDELLNVRSVAESIDALLPRAW